MTVPIQNRSVVLFPKNVRTAGPTGMDEALIDLFRPGKMMVHVENRLVALGTRTAVPSLHLLPGAEN